MQKKWLYRLIMSYIPIFFAVIFCLMLLFFMTMSDLIRKQTLQANGVFASQVIQIVDSTLKNIDTLASKSILLNEKVITYFNSTDPQPPFSYYEVTEVLLDFMGAQSMIDSIYLYRELDGKVLMQHFSSELPEFGDQAFVIEAMKANTPFMWSDIRSLSLFNEGNGSKNVVSLVKKVPYYSGAQGLIVINIRVESMNALIREMNLEGISQLCLADGSGKSFEGIGRMCVNEGEDTSGDTSLKSSLANWSLRIGLQQGGLFTYVSAFSYVWFALGFAAIVGGIVAMTYISHRHYRPLEQVMSRISAFTEKKNSLVKREDSEDEFAFIDKSLESLIEHTNNYDQLQAEGILYRRGHLFKELAEGTRSLSLEKLHAELEAVRITGTFDYLLVGVVEMDDYVAFAAQYTQKDQSLFKFTLRSVVQEIAEADHERLWTEWISPHQLGLLYRMDGMEKERQNLLKVKTMSEKARAWVEQYLKFTVTVGVGEVVKQGEEISESFRQAKASVERKISRGPNSVYVYDPQWGMLAEGRGLNSLLQEMREAAQLYRIGNPDWEILLKQAFLTMTTGVYSKDDMTSLIRMFKAQVNREMQELPQEFQDVWRSGGLKQIDSLPDEFEWIGEAQQRLLPPLLEAQKQLQSLRMNREQYTLASDVQRYLAEHYANPDLSLTHVSEEFDVNIKTLSRVFKEEIGEKFVDYLARIRIEHAKELLEKTAEPVQMISEKVGYLYPMSFIRVFKKLVGTTPGDYRKEHESRRW